MYDMCYKPELELAENWQCSVKVDGKIFISIEDSSLCAQSFLLLTSQQRQMGGYLGPHVFSPLLQIYLIMKISFVR